MMEVTVSSKNQIVIPREAREILALKPGDKLMIVVRRGNVILMQKPESHAAALRGMGKNLYPNGYLKKERGSWSEPNVGRRKV